MMKEMVLQYIFKKNKSLLFSLFANKIRDYERSDRVIATKWDAAFTLHDGIPNKIDLERYQKCTKAGSWKVIL